MLSTNSDAPPLEPLNSAIHPALPAMCPHLCGAPPPWRTTLPQQRGIQPDHFGVLALPVAEFLAVKHNTAYLGYSQHSSSSARHPFFASGPPSTGRRPAAADADAADADAASDGAAAAAMDTSGADDAAGGSGGSGGLSGTPHRRHHHHTTPRRPSSEVGLRLITCAPDTTLGTVSTWGWGLSAMRNDVKQGIGRQVAFTGGGHRTATYPYSGQRV